jgi:hypothetical protein
LNLVLICLQIRMTTARHAQLLPPLLETPNASARRPTQPTDAPQRLARRYNGLRASPDMQSLKPGHMRRDRAPAS